MEIAGGNCGWSALGPLDAGKKLKLIIMSWLAFTC